LILSGISFGAIVRIKVEFSSSSSDRWGLNQRFEVTIVADYGLSMTASDRPCIIGL
jgi:hypothetical protein